MTEAVQVETSVATERLEHQRRERERRARLTSQLSIAARGASYLSRLVVIPLSLKILGTERYGLWLAVGSLIAWLQMSDFGISRGLVNVIAEATGREARQEVRRYISTGTVAFGVLSFAVAILVVQLSRWQGVPKLLNIQDAGLAQEAKILVLICGLYFAASLSLQGAAAVCEGLQEGYLGAGFQVFSALANVAAASLLYWSGSGLTFFALVMAAIPALANAGLAFYIIACRHPDLRPSYKEANWRSLKEIMRFGGPLMVLQMFTVAALYSMNLIIANRLGPAEVPKYSVPYSLFMTIAGVCYLLAHPYIPAYAEARRRGDWPWIRSRALRLLALTACLMGAGSVGLMVIGTPLIRWWAGVEVTPGTELLFWLGVYSVVNIAAATNGVLLIGIGRAAAKAVFHGISVSLMAVGAWLLLPILGLVAIPLSGACALLLDACLSLVYGLASAESQGRQGDCNPGPKRRAAMWRR